MKLRNFLKGTFALTVTAVIINAAGIGLRSYLAKRIGADGIGLYALIMSVVLFAATVAASGISLSVVRLISENDGIRRADADILRCALNVSAALGIFSAAALFLSAERLAADVLNNAAAAQPIRLFALSLPFGALSTCMNGYFTAKGKIAECVKWQLTDELIKICLTVIILNAVPNCTAQSGCRALALAALIGEILSCGHGFVLYDGAREKKNAALQKNARHNGIYADIARISVPTALSSYFRAALTTLENIMIPKCFAKLNDSANSALSKFGILKGMALPVISFPLILMSSAASLLIPELAAAASAGNYGRVRKICRTSIAASAAYSMCAAVFFAIFGARLGRLLFNSAECGGIISIMAFSAPFMYLDSLSDVILKALNQQVASMKYNAAEGIVRIILIYTLVPRFGSSGFMVVIFASNFISAFLGMKKIYSLLNSGRVGLAPWAKITNVRIKNDKSIQNT